MRIGAGQAESFCARPPKSLLGALLTGEDASAVAERRRTLVAALIGPDGEAEMRLTQLDAALLRADGVALDSAVRARGFFPGRRVVLLTGASDALVDRIGAALEAVADMDAVVVVTAPGLSRRSALRAMFEGTRHAASVDCDPAKGDRAAVRARLAAADPAGRLESSEEALSALAELETGLDAGAFARLLETIVLYKRDDPAPLSAEDVAACAPAEIGSETATLILAVLERRPDRARAALARLAAAGTGTTTILIALGRAFNAFHAVATGAEGSDHGLGRVRPLIGAERAAVGAALRRWSPAAIEDAIASLQELDSALRGGTRAPGSPLAERAILRLAMSRDR